MKTEAKDSSLSAEIKLEKLQELQRSLNQLKALKEALTNNETMGIKRKRSDEEEEETTVHFCELQLVETVPDILEQKRLSHQLTQKSIFDVN